MKGNKHKILIAWILLAVFLSVEIEVFTHNISSNTIHGENCHNDENCNICLLFSTPFVPASPATVTQSVVPISQKQYQANTKDIYTVNVTSSLGRAPPLS